MHVCALNGGSVFERFTIYMNFGQSEAGLLKPRCRFGRLYQC